MELREFSSNDLEDVFDFLQMVFQDILDHKEEEGNF